MALSNDVAAQILARLDKLEESVHEKLSKMFVWKLIATSAISLLLSGGTFLTYLLTAVPTKQEVETMINRGPYAIDKGAIVLRLDRIEKSLDEIKTTVSR